MAFDAKKFLRTKWSPRIESVPVPDLQAFFPDGEEAAWRVRGLSGQELGRAAEAAERNRNMAAIIDGLAGGEAREKAQAVRDLLGLGTDTPQDIAKRLEHLVLGSVDPPCPLELAVTLCEAFPVEFYLLTNRIMELTGRGRLPGKQPPSGETARSGPASPLPTPGGGSSTK